GGEALPTRSEVASQTAPTPRTSMTGIASQRMKRMFDLRRPEPRSRLWPDVDTPGAPAPRDTAMVRRAAFRKGYAATCGREPRGRRVRRGAAASARRGVGGC